MTAGETDTNYVNKTNVIFTPVAYTKTAPLKCRVFAPGGFVGQHLTRKTKTIAKQHAHLIQFVMFHECVGKLENIHLRATPFSLCCLVISCLLLIPNFHPLNCRGLFRREHEVTELKQSQSDWLCWST